MAKAEADKGSRSIRALELLEAIVAADRPLDVADVATATGLPKATVYRLCALLEREGFLTPDVASKGLGVGPRVQELALGVMSMSSSNSYRHQILSALSREIGETCNFNVPAGSEILYLDRVETEWPLRTQLPAGSRVPLHCTASGKLYLSSLPAAKRDRLIEALPLEAFTPNTITDAKELVAEVERIRESRVGTDNEEFVTGMVAAAVPIEDAQGRLGALLAFHAPVVRMDMDEALRHVPALWRAANKLSADLREP